MSTGNIPESLSQAILVGRLLVGRLGVTFPNGITQALMCSRFHLLHVYFMNSSARYATLYYITLHYITFTDGFWEVPTVAGSQHFQLYIALLFVTLQDAEIQPYLLLNSQAHEPTRFTHVYTRLIHKHRCGQVVMCTWEHKHLTCCSVRFPFTFVIYRCVTGCPTSQGAARVSTKHTPTNGRRSWTFIYVLCIVLYVFSYLLSFSWI